MLVAVGDRRMQGPEQLTTAAVPHTTRTTRRQAATVFGLGMLACYLCWNVWFLAKGQVPPSMLRGLIGLPAPTTGGTRSFLALLQGHLTASLYYNPMTLPILALLLVTLGQVIWRGRAILALPRMDRAPARGMDHQTPEPDRHVVGPIATW